MKSTKDFFSSFGSERNYWIFLPNLSDTGKNLCRQGIFLCYSKKGVFISWREKCSCYCRSNFFLVGGCSISLKAQYRTGTGTFSQCRGATYSKIGPIPSNLLISSGGNNFVTLTANICGHILGLFHYIQKSCKHKLSFKYFSL
jgi:hypothetical protein